MKTNHPNRGLPQVLCFVSSSFFGCSFSKADILVVQDVANVTIIATSPQITNFLIFFFFLVCLSFIGFFEKVKLIFWIVLLLLSLPDLKFF